MAERMKAEQARALLAKHEGEQPHSALKRQVTDYLRVTGWFVFPVFQGAPKVPVHIHKGISDLIAVKDGRVLFIEIKTGRDKLRPDQQKFRADIESHGGRYIEARCLEDVAGL